jgi:DNA polymerase-3 subunit delta'
MDYIKKFCALSKVKNLLKKLENSSHAIILSSKDSIFLDCLAKLLIMQENCEKKEICFDCANCKKILDGNAIDVEYFGYQKTIVVEDSEQIVADSYIVPLEFEKKYFVLKDFDKATVSAQNKLLKIIEEPQRFDKFILLTTSAPSILPTVRSRCEIYNLPKLTIEELSTLFEYELNDAMHYKTSLFCADGNLTQLEQIYADKNFMELCDLALKVLTNMKNSTMILEFSSAILSYKGELKKFLQILSSYYADMLCIKNGKTNFVQNKQIEVQLKLVAETYSTLAIINILKYINGIMQSLNFNVNASGVVDNLLLKILEIKYICK